MEEIPGERTRKREGWWREENVVPGLSKSNRPPPEPLLSARGWPERGRDNRTESSAAQEYLRDSEHTGQEPSQQTWAPCPRHLGNIDAARTFEDSPLEKRGSQNWLRPTYTSLVEWGLRTDMNLEAGK